jgi:hypothetical protein
MPCSFMHPTTVRPSFSDSRTRETIRASLNRLFRVQDPLGPGDPDMMRSPLIEGHSTSGDDAISDALYSSATPTSALTTGDWYHHEPFVSVASTP